MNVIQRLWRAEARRFNDVTSLEEAEEIVEFMAPQFNKLRVIGEAEDEPGIFLFEWQPWGEEPTIIRTNDPGDYYALRYDFQPPDTQARIADGANFHVEWELDTSL